MGIPRLTTYLAPLAKTKAIGCKTSDCHFNNHDESYPPRKVIIDGPSLAYHIYHKVLAQKTAPNAVDAQPLYGEIAEAVILFLDEISKHHLSM